MQAIPWHVLVFFCSRAICVEEEEEDEHDGGVGEGQGGGRGAPLLFLRVRLLSWSICSIDIVGIGFGSAWMPVRMGDASTSFPFSPLRPQRCSRSSNSPLLDTRFSF